MSAHSRTAVAKNMHPGLRTFIETLEKNGELTRVGESAGTDCQIAGITSSEAGKSEGGKALLFENTATPYPVLTNLFGSEKRMLLALGMDSFEEAADNVRHIIQSIREGSGGLAGKARMISLAGKLSSWGTKLSGNHARCQDSVQYIAKLSSLPILKSASEDAGRSIYAAMLNTANPETGARNLENVRLQLIDDTTTGMGWKAHSAGRRNLALCTHRLPAAICLGGDPLYSFLSSLNLPANIDKYILAGFLRNSPVEMVECMTQKLQVPADCDFVIEGYIQKSEDLFSEGPFACSSGFYVGPSLCHKFHVTCITHRSDAIFPAFVPTVPGEESKIAAAAIGHFYSSGTGLSLSGEIKGVSFPSEALGTELAVVQIENSYEGQPFKVAGMLWGSELMMLNKCLVIVDGQTDIHNPDSIRNAIEKNYLPSRDTLISRGPLDSSAANPGKTSGGKICIDATFHEEGGSGKPFEEIFDIRLDEALAGASSEKKIWYVGNVCDALRDISIADETVHIDAAKGPSRPMRLSPLSRP